MIVLGIDPGSEQSWWLKWDTDKQVIIEKGVSLNTDFDDRIIFNPYRIKGIDIVVIEDIQCFGMPVGQSVFETAKAVGRFLEKAESNGVPIIQAPRKEIKLHFCNSTKAKDSNIRQAIIDRFGGKEKAIGYKKTPGVLYGVKKHLWSALALCLWYGEIGLLKPIK